MAKVTFPAVPGATGYTLYAKPPIPAPVEAPPSVFKDASVPKYRPWRLRVPETVARAQRCTPLLPLTWTSRFLAVEYAKRMYAVLLEDDGYKKGYAYMVAAVVDMRKFVEAL